MSVPNTISRYEIKRPIAQGGMAAVYLAYDPHFKREVALKILPAQFTHDPMFRLRFEREAQTIAALEHPAIVPVYDYGQQGKQPFLVMRYMRGGSLAQRMRQGPIPRAEIAQIVERISSALDRAHAKGVIHRDLKPGNILFDQMGNAYLADFGIAKLTEESATITGTHNLVGTPAYMSPEQVQGKPLDGRSDLYNLGVIVYEMLAGQQPFAAETPIGLAFKHVHEVVPDILTIQPDLPVDIDKFMTRALAKEPEDRFRTGEELSQILGQAVLPKHERFSAFADQTEAFDFEPVTAPTKIEREAKTAPSAAEKTQVGKRISPVAYFTVVALALVVVGALFGMYLSGGAGGDEGGTPVAQLSNATDVVAAIADTVTPTVAATETETPSATPSPTASATPSTTETATLEPTAVPSPTAPPNLVINVSSVNIRRGPGTRYEVLQVGRLGDAFDVLAVAGTWYLVDLRDGKLGWVSSTVGDVANAAALAAVPTAVTIPAPPTATSTPIPSPTPRPTNTPVSPPSGGGNNNGGGSGNSGGGGDDSGSGGGKATPSP